MDDRNQLPTLREVDPPLKRPRAHQTGRINWRQAWEDLDDMAESTVYGWVRIQSKAPEGDRLRAWEIAQRLDVSSDLLDVRYEPSTVGSRWWNETRGNEISSERVLRKIRSQKKELAEIWGWDTWIRWTPPETLAEEQVARVDRIWAQHDKNEADYRKELTPRLLAQKARDEMDPFERRVHDMREDIEGYPIQMRPPMQEELRLLIAGREIALKKNHRMGEVGIDAWRRSLVEDAITRGRRIYEKAQATKRQKKFAGMNAREMRAVMEAEEREKNMARLAKLYPGTSNQSTMKGARK